MFAVGDGAEEPAIRGWRTGREPSGRADKGTCDEVSAVRVSAGVGDAAAGRRVGEPEEGLPAVEDTGASISEEKAEKTASGDTGDSTKSHKAESGVDI